MGVAVPKVSSSGCWPDENFESALQKRAHAVPVVNDTALCAYNLLRWYIPPLSGLGLT